MSYPLLERINAPGEIKNLPASDMPALCEEIRQFLIKSVSETGGHLSSNLGVVELTVACTACWTSRRTSCCLTSAISATPTSC